jgi:hypothetical protein
MSSDFWAKVRGVTPSPAPQPTQWRPSAPQTAPGRPQPTQINHPGLAVPTQVPSTQDAQLQQFYEQGFNDKHTPTWAKNQPSDYCPQCQGARYVISQQVGYCWDCGYNNRRTMSDAQVGNFSSPSGGGATQPTRQIPQGMKNFGNATSGI